MKIQKASLVSGFLAFLVLSYIFFPESIDDAYITLRYSKNLILGNGPVFNIGERVEGYSNFSWMVLLATLGWIGVPMEMAMKFLSMASGLGVLALVWKLSANNFKSDLAISSPVILLGVSSFFAVWAVDGLETMFYTMLLTSLVYTLTTDRANTLLIGIIASLVALTRPEGIMFSLIAVICLAFQKRFVSSLKTLALLAVFAGGYELFRLHYFGEFVSNTALAKVHASFDKSLEGLWYLLAYNAKSGYLMLPSALIGAAAFIKNARLRIPIIFVLAQILFLMISGGDFMYAYRFIIPVMPCIALLCASAIDILCVRVNRVVALLALIVIATCQAYSQYSFLPGKHLGFDNLTFRTAPHFAIAEFLAQRSGPNDWILLSEAGIIPFYIDAKVRDYLGLTSPFYSIVNPDRTVNSDYLFSVRPKFVIISFIETEKGFIYPRMGVEAKIQANSAFGFYRPVRDFDIPESSSFLNYIYYDQLPNEVKRVFFTVFERVG